MNSLVSQAFSGPWGITGIIGVIGLVAVAGGLIIAVVAVVTSYFRDSQRDEMDATLKMEMIQRGMSADEIEKVLKASSGSFDPSALGRRTGPRLLPRLRGGPCANRPAAPTCAGLAASIL